MRLIDVYHSYIMSIELYTHSKYILFRDESASCAAAD